MKAKAKTVRSTSPFAFAANHDQPRAAGFAVDFQDLCAQEMDRALGIHKASLDSAVQMHSCAMEMYQVLDLYNHASWFQPALAAVIGAAAESFARCMQLHAHCMEIHRTWLTLLAPYLLSYREASSFLHEAEATAEELAYHMDIAIGERRFSDDQIFAVRAGLPARTAESDMDAAMGQRAA